MKQKWKDFLPAVLMGVVLPWLLFNTAGTIMRQDKPVPEISVLSTENTTMTENTDFWLDVLSEEGLVRIPLEEYLVGVVLGEMPASFETEALKAQAVVARTYTLRRAETESKHEGGVVCTSPECCQAYMDPQVYLTGNGTQADVDKVTGAVRSTAGQVLTYDGKLIEATYFSSSGGRTEDAVAVWGTDLPYLQATDSPEDDYEDKYMETLTITAHEFQEALGLNLSGRCESWIESVRYTNGGGVDTMVIGGTSFKGTDLRTLLGLRSTAFTITASGSSVTITTRGYGHRVGMSQYGAEAMAVAGCTYDEILTHYYQGVVLEEYIDNQGIFG